MIQKTEKSLCVKNFRKKGRNNRGLITCRHRGGGHKRLYRKIEFNRLKVGIYARVHRIDYDPNRSSKIALLHYTDGIKTYIIHPLNLKIGDYILSSPKAPISVGNCLPLRNMPLGTVVHNIEINPGKGGQLVRSAGSSAQILSKQKDSITLSLPSSEIRLVSKNCWATIGQVSNIKHNNRVYKKAGRKRWLDRRPSVRGAAMNAVDHPHGGGEGRAPVGRPGPLTPWGKATLGKRTRKINKYSNKLILTRRK
uniref:Large ribosomal subunit protein uL2c n=2 Tax=unclassified Ostreobium TaxID=2086555 RepID=A0A1X9RQ73_9CHLO|nr:ribosomal protein L2 [Ostreobium sp. HV05042]ARQ82318.1 ribosomal protein L2 [Ostreobium sp. HV05007a]